MLNLTDFVKKIPKYQKSYTNLWTKEFILKVEKS